MLAHTPMPAKPKDGEKALAPQEKSANPDNQPAAAASASQPNSQPAAIAVTPSLPKKESFDFAFMSKKLKVVLLKKNSDNKEADDREMDDKKDEEDVHYAFSPEELRLLIKDKQKKRPLDAHVVVGGFARFMSQVHEDRVNRKGKFPRRIQVAYKRGDKDADGLEYEHWTAIDILVTANKTHVFYLDASGSEFNLDIIQRAVVLHPDTELTICEDVEVAGKSIALQKDNESCSTFTLDHIFHMSKLADLHQYLNAVRTADPDHANVFHVDPRQLPPVLVRNAQSMTFVKQYLADHKEWEGVKVDKQGRTLMQYVNKHMLFFPEAGRDVIGSIQHKQIQYAKRIGLTPKK